MVCNREEREKVKKRIIDDLRIVVYKLAGKCRSPYESAPPPGFSSPKYPTTVDRPQTAPACVENCPGIHSNWTTKCQCSPDPLAAHTSDASPEEVLCCLPVEVLETINEDGDCTCRNPQHMVIAYRLAEAVPLNKSKSRELRGGIIYQGCDCERRNGLQDSCPRYECQGRPVCLLPNPKCGPSAYAFGKHLGKKKEREIQYQFYPAFVRPSTAPVTSGEKELKSRSCKFRF